MYLCETENKLTLHCEGNGKGTCLGEILFLPEIDLESILALKKESISPKSAEKELERYISALEKTKKERDELYFSLKDECDAAWIFLMHTTLLRSSLFTERAMKYISDGKGAESAVLSAWEHFAYSLETDRYKVNLGSVALDLKDVCISLLLNLRASLPPSLLNEGEEKILLCSEPLPSFIVKNRKKISAVAAPLHIRHSCAFELLSSLSIPTVLSDEEFSSSYDDEHGIVDSDRGILHISPDLSTLEDFSELEEKKRQYEKRLASISEREIRNADGKKLSLFAEIERDSEIDHGLSLRCDGIGLLSSEELYLEKLCMPDEDSLFERYRKAAELMPTKPVIIRAFRTSGEVRVNSMVSERNGEKHGEVYVFQSSALRTQLRAAMRSSVYGNIYFVLSPHGSHSSIGRCERITDELTQELHEENREFSTVQIGVQINTPAEALTCKASVKDADFAVINTEKLSELLDGADTADGEYESAIKNEALYILLTDIAKIKKETGKKFLVSLGKKANAKLLKKALSLGFEDFSVAALSLPETKLMMSEML